jgi:hypothetical protein
LGEVSLSRWLCLFIPGVAGGKPHKSWHSSVGLHLPSRLELVSGSMGALLLSQYNMAWRSFLWAGGSGCRSFTSSFLVFSTKCGSGVSARFLIYGAHAVCFCTLYAILDQESIILNYRLLAYTFTKLVYKK